MFRNASAFAPSSTRIYLYAQNVDMRKSFDGLCGIVQAEFARDIRDGELYLFLNRRGDRIKAMYWDRDGIAIWQDKACGIASPERSTSLVEGNKYDTSVAATIIEAKWFHYIPICRCQDLFSGSGWTPSRSTQLNIVTQSAFVLASRILFMKRLVQNDTAVGIDDTSCRMLLPREIPEFQPGDLKGQRLAEKLAEPRRKGHISLLAKMWVYSGLNQARYNIFDFRVSRHREGPEEFFASSRCKVQGDCYSGNTGNHCWSI